ncbi:MAG: hypothetical protein RBG13Loki_2099 [Promethearchaeota archaeon CR_4]|nr:MAG: hypothetical protein RBG13Loki_2099 [Candidatus Lokiarchaeota archaeon CR_4]
MKGALVAYEHALALEFKDTATWYNLWITYMSQQREAEVLYFFEQSMSLGDLRGQQLINKLRSRGIKPQASVNSSYSKSPNTFHS